MRLSSAFRNEARRVRSRRPLKDKFFCRDFRTRSY